MSGELEDVVPCPPPLVEGGALSAYGCALLDQAARRYKYAGVQRADEVEVMRAWGHTGPNLDTRFWQIVVQVLHMNEAAVARPALVAALRERMGR